MEGIQFFVFGVPQGEPYVIPVGQYGKCVVKSASPVFIAEAVFSTYNEFSVKIPCLKEANGPEVGSIVVTAAMLGPKKYFEKLIPLEGNEKSQILLCAFPCFALKEKFGPRHELNLPEKFVIGHRGSGNNVASDEFLENSIPGFLDAAKNHADVVEFDIQFTKEKIPVIFHNFVVDFEVEHPEFGQPNKVENGKFSYTVDQFTLDQFIATGLETKWKCPRPTFQELLEKVPESMVFDVEMKYPTIAKWNKITFLERNECCDRTLEDIRKYGGDRRIFFSSFDPVICILLAQKQKKYPVYQLITVEDGEATEGPCGFEYKIHLLADLHKFTGVEGFVLESKKTLALMPGIYKELVNMGYKVSTYGAPNNKKEESIKQLELGVMGICTDKVSLIREAVDEFVAGSK